MSFLCFFCFPLQLHLKEALVFILVYYFMCMSVRLSVCGHTTCVCKGVLGGQKREVDPVGLELKATMRGWS